MAAAPVLSWPYLSTDLLQFAGAKSPRLKLGVYSAVAATVILRGLTRHGAFGFSFIPVTTRTLEEPTFPLPEIPLVVMLGTSTSPIRRGELFAHLTLQLEGFDVLHLAHGYISDSFALSWPPGMHQDGVEGPGRLVLNADEALNDSDKVFTVPTNSRWRFQSLWAELTTTATAGTREIEWHLRDSAADVVAGHMLMTPPASNTARLWGWSPIPFRLRETGTRDFIGANEATGNPSQSASFSLPDFPLSQGFDARLFDVAAIDAAADDLIIQFLTEEWIEE